jgi:hypothetical protein
MVSQASLMNSQDPHLPWVQRKKLNEPMPWFWTIDGWLDEVVHHLCITHDSTHGIIKDQFGFHEVCARWVLKQLTGKHRRICLTFYNGLLNHCCNESDTFLRHSVTGDKMWREEHNSKLCLLYRNASGPIETGYLNKIPRTVVERCRKVNDNACCHTATHTIKSFRQLNFEVLKHPLYGPDLAPSDYHLFDPLTDTREASISPMTRKWNKQCIQKHVDCWTKRIEKDVGYEEKRCCRTY